MHRYLLDSSCHSHDTYQLKGILWDGVGPLQSSASRSRTCCSVLAVSTCSMHPNRPGLCTLAPSEAVLARVEAVWVQTSCSKDIKSLQHGEVYLVNIGSAHNIPAVLLPYRIESRYSYLVERHYA